MDRGTGNRRLTSLVLHDVELTALRPRNSWKSFAKHPERGPESLPRGKLDASLHHPRLRMELSARGDLPGRVAARAVVAAHPRGSDACRDHQLPAAVERDVGRGRGIVLLLLISPAAVSHGAAVRRVGAPFRRIDEQAGISLELIAPDERPLLRGNFRRGPGWRFRRRRAGTDPSHERDDGYCANHSSTDALSTSDHWKSSNGAVDAIETTDVRGIRSGITVELTAIGMASKDGSVSIRAPAPTPMPPPPKLTMRRSAAAMTTGDKLSSVQENVA